MNMNLFQRQNTKKKRKDYEKTSEKVKPRLSLFSGCGDFVVLGDNLQVRHKSYGILDFRRYQ